MMITFLEQENDFKKLIGKGLILVDFYADWCGPCKALGPILEQLDGVNILKVNVDSFDEIAASYGIMSIPTLILFKDGEMIDKKVGLISKSDLEEWVNENK